MNSIIENITEIVNKTVEKNGFLLIDLIIRGTEKNRVIEVYVDGEMNISADTCAELSQKIKNEIDTQLPQLTNYRLDVSSPGTDRPLKYLLQYYKHINRKFDIVYLSGSDLVKLHGKLISIDGDYLKFISNNREVIINFNNITKANVVVSFS